MLQSLSVRTQCSKFGTVTKVVLYDKHPDGVCQVAATFEAFFNFMWVLFCQVYFKEVSEADMAVEMLNGRMFGRKVLTTNFLSNYI